jgi:hypothetical protein
MKSAYLTFEILCMLVQVIHSYQLFAYASNLPQQARIWAGLIFCLIVDCSIVFATVDAVWWWTISGSLILVVINVLYTYNTTEDFRELDQRRSENRRLVAKRRQVVSYFIGILNPVLLLIFSLLYAKA